MTNKKWKMRSIVLLVYISWVISVYRDDIHPLRYKDRRTISCCQLALAVALEHICSWGIRHVSKNKLLYATCKMHFG